MRLLVAAALAMAISGCDNAPTGSDPSGPVGAGGPVGENAANTAVPLEPEEAGDLPEQSEGLRFIGNWAPDEKSCTSAAWQFSQTTLRTPAGANCSFNRVTEVSGGYDIQATCTAEGDPTSDTLKLRFAVLSKAMMFESRTIADTPLIYCGRDV